MRKICSALLVWLALLGSAMAQAPAPLPPRPDPAPAPAPKPCPCDNCKDCTIDAPESIKVYVGRDYALEVKCDRQVQFLPPDMEEDITMVVTAVPNTFTVKAYVEGSYKLWVMVACGGKVKMQKITVEAVEKGVKPRPKPDPAPPGPAPAPTPLDPIVKDLAAAYSLDATADKATQVQALAAVYKTAVDKVDSAETGAKLLADLKSVAGKDGMKIPDDAIPLVRSRIAVELKKTIVAGSLSPEQKRSLKSLFGRLAAALAACK